MELIRGLHNLRPHHRGCVATIGAFDGVHIGHQAVIGQLRARAERSALPATVIVFEPLPREYFSPVEAPSRLMSFREKFAALRELEVDRVLRIRFDRALTQMSAEDFIEHVFVHGLDVRSIVVGDDLHFGRGREGDFQLLKDAGHRHGFDVADTVTVELDGERVSSTRLRSLLEAGDFVSAERMLGRPYSISGKVVYGRQLGASLGTPTANLKLHRLRAPLAGVHAVEVNGVEDKVLAAVANVGTRPTVTDSIEANLEVHLLDYAGNLYGRNIDVRFRNKIREEKRFASLDELKAAIKADIVSARALLAPTTD